MGNHASYKKVPSPAPYGFNLSPCEEGSKSFKVKSYWCSQYFAAHSLLLRGESSNPDSESRNAVLTATDIRDGAVIGESVFSFVAIHRPVR